MVKKLIIPPRIFKIKGRLVGFNHIMNGCTIDRNKKRRHEEEENGEDRKISMVYIYIIKGGILKETVNGKEKIIEVLSGAKMKPVYDCNAVWKLTWQLQTLNIFWLGQPDLLLAVLFNPSSLHGSVSSRMSSRCDLCMDAPETVDTFGTTTGVTRRSGPRRNCLSTSNSSGSSGNSQNNARRGGVPAREAFANNVY